MNIHAVLDINKMPADIFFHLLARSFTRRGTIIFSTLYLRSYALLFFYTPTINKLFLAHFQLRKFLFIQMSISRVCVSRKLSYSTTFEAFLHVPMEILFFLSAQASFSLNSSSSSWIGEWKISLILITHL